MPSTPHPHDSAPIATRPEPHGRSPAKWPADTRMLAQQQARLLAGMTRLLCRLLRSLLWKEMRPAEQRRVAAMLSRLEHDLSLLRLVMRTPPPLTDDEEPY